MRIEMILIRSL